jgi:hypothetical protein
MVTIILSDALALECKSCKAPITMWSAPDLKLKKPKVSVPFRIHLTKYTLDSTKFKLIDFKSTKINGECTNCGNVEEANLLFDDEGRSFGIFTDNIEDRYLFQHSPGIKDKEKYRKDLLKVDYCD